MVAKPCAFLWKDGVMTDLNALIPSDSPLYLLAAFWINDSGEIAGFGVQKVFASLSVCLASGSSYVLCAKRGCAGTFRHG